MLRYQIIIFPGHNNLISNPGLKMMMTFSTNTGHADRSGLKPLGLVWVNANKMKSAGTRLTKLVQ